MHPRKVEVVPYDPDWVLLFEQERRMILESVKQFSMIIHHIGSTAVPGLSAKPIIDLLGETDDIKMVDRNADKFKKVGYMPKGEYGIEGRRFFIKKK